MRQPQAFVVPASLQQEAELVTSRRDVASINLCSAMRARGSLDVSAARAALDELVDRHEVFRSCLRRVGGGVVQVIQPPGLVPFELVEVGARRPGRQIRRVLSEFLRKPFVLTQAPLMRAVIVRIGAEEHLLCWALPHTIWDAATERLFFDEFVALYEALAGTARLHPLFPQLQFGDIAAWERTLEDAAASAHWHRVLRGASGRVALPFDRGRADARSYHGRFQLLPRVSSTFSHRLATVAREGSATRAMVVATSLAALLHGYSRQDDIVFSLGHANRGRAETEEILGPLFDVLPLRVDMSGAPTFRQLLERVRQATTDAYRHRLPGLRLLDMLSEPCDVMLNFQYATTSPTHEVPCSSGVTFSRFRPATWEQHFPSRHVWWRGQVSVDVVARSDNTLTGDLTFNQQVLGIEDAKAFAAAHSRMLQYAALFPDRRIADLVGPVRLGSPLPSDPPID